MLLMTQLFLGYPSFEDSERMMESGVELIELQIPFPNPSPTARCF